MLKEIRLKPMPETTIFIKNMVCDRCIMAVKQTLDKLDLPWSCVELGRAKVNVDEKDIDFELLDKELRNIGFELIRDKNQLLVERVKNLIVEYIHHNEGEQLKINFSDYLSDELEKDYSHISSSFSKSENMTIEKFIILQKIERVKELVSYDELNFSEIAFKVNYSSVAHLSRQFKSVTGMTLSQYKSTRLKDRNRLDKVK
jgi:AraC-like DNA-binding protein